MKARGAGALLAALAGLAGAALGAQVDLAAREQAAREVADAFIQGLGMALKEQMAKGGPAAAIKVCREIAPEIAGKLSRAHGWRVTRVGTRVRNPLLGMPDAWEQDVLAAFARRVERGEALAGMRHAEIVSEPGGRYFRYMQAIGVQPLCLTCHGGVEQIPAAVKTALDKDYPSDQATGYKAGDLRGAISIKQPLPRL